MSDPIRLRDPRAGASPQLRELLAAGRSEMPDAKRLGAIAGRLGLVSASSGGIDGIAHGLGKWLGTGAAKAGTAALLVTVGAAFVVVRGHARLPSAPEAPAISGPPATSAPLAPPSLVEAREARQAVPDPTPVASSVRSNPPGPARASNRASPAPAVPSTAAPERPVEHPPGWAPSTWGSSMAPPPVAPAVDALDPSRALELALRDERSSDRLVEQRDLVIIHALVRLGRMTEARERATRFLRIFPGSSHRSEVAELVGFDPGIQNP